MLKLVGLLLLVCHVELLIARECYEHRECKPGECCLKPYIMYSRRDVDRETTQRPKNGTCSSYVNYGGDCDPSYTCGCWPWLQCTFTPNYKRIIGGKYNCTLRPTRG